MAMTADERKALIQQAIALPHAEAIDFMRDRILLTPKEYRQLTDKYRARAFALAGVERMAALKRIDDALFAAVSEGESFGTFKKRIKDEITAQNWAKRRVATVFRTNIQTAYNAGHWSRYRKDGVEVLVYDAVGDSRTRPTHAALDGKAFRIDDPFWDEWFPPNGFGCRCSTQGMSAIEAEARGIIVGDGNDPGSRIVDLGNGQTQHIIPDPGFGYNPGKAAFGLEPDISAYDAAAKPDPDPRFQDNRPAGLADWKTVAATAAPNRSANTYDELASVFQAKIEAGVLNFNGDLIWHGNVNDFIGHVRRKDANRRLEVLPFLFDTALVPDEVFFQRRQIPEVNLKPKSVAPDERIRYRQVCLKKWRLANGTVTTHVVVMDWGFPGWHPITSFQQPDDVEVEKLRIGILMKKK